MAELIFFGHDAHDAAVQRRIKAFEQTGASVRAFTMRRGPAFATPWINVDLGETHDAAFGQRIGALLRAQPILRARREALKRADVFYARNLDMLALAAWARGMSGSRAKLIYECLDVHRFMTRSDQLGAAMRFVERRLLAGAARVVVSSPAFVREYFDVHQPGRASTVLIENRLPPAYDYGPRPIEAAERHGPIRIGWFGNLRCRRSLDLLLALAARLGERVALSFRGAPARTEIADFEARVAAYPNVTVGGRYAWPQGLASIYGDVDLVWAGDFHDPGANSKWLLPNRLYEGGYYCAPPIAPADSETGRWIERHGFGFTLAEPLEETLPALVESLNRERIAAARAKLAQAPESLFVQPADELKQLLNAVLAEEGP
ncbi:MAG TPA: glycosyltransferase [Vitreimonas sp.]|uniref:glycosyltransferase n=1 Tax=Vitreimonas sp. TaxID=3069702 RepID=UPI002D73A806|nr:glycosyltransferase [Vitreimonas sp.]HYD88952.1 glycosyltransferase [Vitreimonas sp.]